MKIMHQRTTYWLPLMAVLLLLLAGCAGVPPQVKAPPDIFNDSLFVAPLQRPDVSTLFTPVSYTHLTLPTSDLV